MGLLIGTQGKSGGVGANPPTPAEIKPISVRFIDHEGLIATQYFNKGESATAYPTPKVYSDITFDEWTHNLSELSNLEHDIDVGAIYKSTDGSTIADITLTPTTGLTPPLYYFIYEPATFRIDWGDGSYTDVSTSGDISHNYLNYGNYRIKINRISGTGTIVLGGGNINVGFIGAGYSSLYTRILRSIIIGEYTSINAYAFYWNNSLSRIVIPITDDLTYIPTNTFVNCVSLTSIVIPNNVSYVMEAAFMQCYSLKYIVINNSVTYFGNFTFNNCVSLPSIVLPTGLNNTGNSTFSYCRALSKIIIPNGLMTIGTKWLDFCSSLLEIIIPKSISSIGDSALTNIEGNRTYIFNSLVPPSIGAYTFDGLNPITKIYVPDTSVAAYKSATNWIKVSNYIHPISNK